MNKFKKEILINLGKLWRLVADIEGLPYLQNREQLLRVRDLIGQIISDLDDEET